MQLLGLNPEIYDPPLLLLQGEARGAARGIGIIYGRDLCVKDGQVQSRLFEIFKRDKPSPLWI